MQVNVHLCVGEHETMPDSKLLAVVGQVDVPGVPHLAKHGVQAHEVHSRVDSTSEINNFQNLHQMHTIVAILPIIEFS